MIGEKIVSIDDTSCNVWIFTCESGKIFELEAEMFYIGNGLSLPQLSLKEKE